MIEPKFVPTALKVAVVVGSILFAINHGSALLTGNMGRDRWISAILTYVVPYFVNIHGQYISIHRRK
ncbi:nitrate/nitrite transporter NrtS [Anabaena subtropica FACHB-260]|uniref:Nitrate/nitrite transporter NrtS n=1 Tax=Anabaena subtropica FACHB-260 TaxID=2692884 RepID=A0ABR8CTC1_9NOST|nr:nitrate/nitrite transporter NrtS [Anabaena subtropica FACHB-260]